MAFKPACALDELWEGEMKEVEIDGTRVLLVHAARDHVSAFAAMCPHQEFPLANGDLSDGVLTCAAHLWQFDARTGAGLNPVDCALRRYATRCEDGQILVDLEASVPSGQ